MTMDAIPVARKRSVVLRIAFGAGFAMLLVASAALLIQNQQEIDSARLRELLALQTGDLSEAILFNSRQAMLRNERNFFFGGAGIGLVGLLAAIYAVRRAMQANRKTLS